MQRAITMIICIVLTGSVSPKQPVGKARQKHAATLPETIEDIKKRPDLGVDYGRVAKFKIASRKATYHVGEMIRIDLAMINASNNPIFFHLMDRPSLEIVASDENGADAVIRSSVLPLEGVSPSSYRRIEPNRLNLASFRLLVGCTSDLDGFLGEIEKLDMEEAKSGEDAYFRSLFDRGLFVDWGEACLSAKVPARYTFVAQQTNAAVVISQGNPKVKTAVGTIRSSPLTLTVIQ